jgi:hypothetical protein
MSISRLGHFLRVVATAAPAVATEVLTHTPLAHLAWAPAAIFALRWLGQEIAAASAKGGP